MKIKHIVVFGLLFAVTLSGCSQGNSALNGIVSPDEARISPSQTPYLIEAAENSGIEAQAISFSAGELLPPIETPEPKQSAEPTTTATPAQEQRELAVEETAAPIPKATPKPTTTPIVAMPTITTPVPTAKPKSTATPKPTATPIVAMPPITTPIVAMPTIATPVPVATPAPTATPIGTPVPVATSTPIAIQAPTPEPHTARTICNSCGADITGNVPAHGDGHLLNGENFSYRVE